jgi:hypothetical protein
MLESPDPAAGGNRLDVDDLADDFNAFLFD